MSGVDAHATICSSYPFLLQNGQTANADQVMANFNCAALTSGATMAGPTFTGTVISTTIANSGNIATGSISGQAAVFAGSGAVALNTVTDFFGNTNSDNKNLVEFQTGQFQKTGAVFVNVGASVSDPVSQIVFEYGAGIGAGSIISTGTNTVYGTTSDVRLKDVSPHQKDYRSAIKALWVGDFNWKDGGAPSFGILAQQAYPLFPFAVSKPSDPKKMWEADYGKLAPLALWGVKDLYREDDLLWAALAALALWNGLLTILILKRRQ